MVETVNALVAANVLRWTLFTRDVVVADPDVRAVSVAFVVVGHFAVESVGGWVLEAAVLAEFDDGVCGGYVFVGAL